MTKQTKSHTFDERWYQALEPKSSVSLISYYSYAAQELTQARRIFNQEHQDYPRLSPPQIKTEENERNISYLKNLAREIVQSEKNILIQKAYLRRIDELIDLNRFIMASATEDDELFGRLSKKLYGTAVPGVVAATCRFLRLRLAGKTVKVGNDALNLLVRGESLAEPARLLLETDIFLEAKARFGNKFGGELEVFEDWLGELGALDIKKAMDGFLSRGQLGGWRARVAEGGSGSIRVEHLEREIIIPADKVVSADRLKELVVHEVLTHVLRRQRGEQNKLKLLGIGLDHYLPGEEAVAIFRQQLLKESPTVPVEILWRYFLITLCLGQVDGRPRNFRQIYDMAGLFFQSEYSDEERAGGKAEEAAWNLTVRIFRGVRGETPGICYTKDLVYLNGYSRLMETLRVKPERQELFDTGKLDVSNEEHVNLTKELGL